jgi:hypothetical protein
MKCIFADFCIDHTLTREIYRCWYDTGSDIIGKLLCGSDSIITSDYRTPIRYDRLDCRSCEELSSDKYSDWFSDESFCEFGKYLFPFVIEDEIDLWTTRLSE